jgi:hypothetical protein
MNQIKCPKCGFTNAYGTKKCFKCHCRLEKGYISCPKCAKKNNLGVTRCVNCGCNLKKKRIGLFGSLLISLLISLALLLAVHLNKKEIIGSVRIVYVVIAVVIILSILYTTLTYGRKEITNFDAEEAMNDNNPRLLRLKLISSIAVAIGCIAVAVFVIFKFVLNK